MNHLFEIIKKFFKKRGGDWIILIISLFLAFVMWSILRLSQTYSTTFRYDVEVTTNLKGRASTAISTDPILVRGRATGFFILQHRYYEAKSNIVDISVEPKYIKKDSKNDDLFYVKSSDIKDNLSQALDGEIRVENITFDSLFFYFYSQSYKKIPVVPRLTVSYSPQYMEFTPVILKPDSILIYGRTSFLENIDSVFTYEIRGDRLKKSLSGIVGLEAIPDIKFGTDEVYFSLEVGRYFEKSFSVPINFLDFPNKDLLSSHKEVKLTFRVKFDNKKKILPQDFIVIASYGNKIKNKDGSSFIELESNSFPENVYDIKLDPPYIRVY